MSEHIEKRKITPQEAVEQIHDMLLQIMTSGSVDTEPQEIRTIIDDLQSGAINPETALDKAQKILNSRQDYH